MFKIVLDKEKTISWHDKKFSDILSKYDWGLSLKQIEKLAKLIDRMWLKYFRKYYKKGVILK